jgi:voltage-gated potassium channel
MATPAEEHRFGRAGDRLKRRELTVTRATIWIAVVTLVVTVAGGILMRVVDAESFPNIGRGLWWAAQTVTTVGYGDVVPQSVGGRALAVLVMATGIAFLSVFTALITAAFIESLRRRFSREHEDKVETRLEEIAARLAAIEAALSPGKGEAPSPHA